MLNTVLFTPDTEGATHLSSYGCEVYLLGAQIKLLHGQILLQLVDFVVQLTLQAARLRAIQCINRVLQMSGRG